jgi:hypothetical protein
VSKTNYLAERAATVAMEQSASKIVNKCFDTNICSYLDTSGGQSLNQYLDVVHFFSDSVK